MSASPVPQIALTRRNDRTFAITASPFMTCLPATGGLAGLGGVGVVATVAFGGVPVVAVADGPV
jgi:hypothetical protein